MHDETLSIIAGREPLKNSGSVNTPIHRTSTVLFKTLEEYHKACDGSPVYDSSKNSYNIDYSYATTGTPTTVALRKAIAKLEGGDDSLILPTGLSAITTTLLSILKSGDHLLVVDSVYGPTRRFCIRELKKFGIETEFYDPSLKGDIKNLFRPNTKAIFCESPGSITFEVQDIPAISTEAKKKDIIVICDNSWASSIYFKPFKHGVDISIQAGTKYICGHSDILLGVITATKEYFPQIFNSFRNYGNVASPDECYMASRGLRTMAVRLKRHEESALEIANWLKTRKEVKAVLHPALPDCKGHEVFKRDFIGSGGLFSIVLDKKYSNQALSAMIDKLKYFGIGCSWGGYESLILTVDPSSYRKAPKWTEKNSMIRIFIGLENPEDLKSELDKGFKRLTKYP